MKIKTFLCRILLGVLVIVMSGCVKNEFTVEFKLAPDSDGDYRMVYYASDKKQGFWVETVAPVHGGQCVVKGITRMPSVCYIYGRNAKEPMAAFYVERGDKIKVTGKGPDPAAWSYEGNSLTEEWSEWRNGALKELQSGDAVKINDAVARYVKAHKDDKLSCVLLLTSFSRRENPDGFVDLWNMLGKKGRPEKLVSILSAADLNSSVPFSILDNGKIRLTGGNDRLPKMILHTMGNGVDTLNPGKGTPSIFYFWNAGVDDRSEGIDTLRRISRQYRDSLRRNIVDVCMDADSMAWMGNTRFDSLERALRVWMPMGVLDDNARKMGVARTPYYVVSDGKGKIIYGGEDAGKASEKFRRLMKKQ